MYHHLYVYNLDIRELVVQKQKRKPIRRDSYFTFWVGKALVDIRF